MVIFKYNTNNAQNNLCIKNKKKKSKCEVKNKIFNILILNTINSVLFWYFILIFCLYWNFILYYYNFINMF